MKITNLLLTLIVCIIAANSFADDTKLLSTHIYKNIAIQEFNIKKSDTVYENKIIIGILKLFL